MVNKRAQTKAMSEVLRRLIMLPAVLVACMASTAWGLEIHSAQVDRVGETIVVKGSGFSAGTSFTLTGVTVPANDISANEQSIAFGPELASAALWRGSYKLIAEDGGVSVEFSVYIGSPINDATPPPPGGDACPCKPGWEASAISRDNTILCSYGEIDTQIFMIGVEGRLTISAQFDPNNLFFDPVNPGNSVSICALQKNSSYPVAEPLVNQAQYDDCETWFWQNICL